MAAAKKPSLADVAVLEPVEDDEEEDDGYAAAVDELAEVMGIPEDKMDVFRGAFQAAVMSCK